LALALAALPAILAMGGCAPDATIPIRRDLIEAQDQLKRAKDEDLALQEQLRQRDEQVRTLQALGTGKRMESLFTVKRVQIGSYSSGVNLDEKPGDDGVKVFVEPVDSSGSTIKAAGDVTIQLYDLAAPPGENLLQTFHYGPDEIAAKWTNGFLTQFFLFECVWDKDHAPKHDQVTIRVIFVDYLTGNTFTDQKAVHVALPGSAQPTTATGPATASAPTTAPAEGKRPATERTPTPATAPAAVKAPTTGPQVP
jgi:hypothetical protein